MDPDDERPLSCCDPSQIAARLERVAAFRASRAKRRAHAALCRDQPHRFVQISYRPTDSIIVPSISSERREYIPMGYLGPRHSRSRTRRNAVYDAEPGCSRC